MAGKSSWQQRASKELAAHITEKIETVKILNFLQSHIFEGKEASKTQVTAAISLLKKVVPDLSSIDMKSESVVHQISDQPLPSEEQWEETYSIQ